MKVRYGNYCFGRDVKFLTVCKAVLAVNKTISMDSNRGTGLIKISETTFIRTLEIVLYVFGKDNSPEKEKQQVEVEIPKWLCMKGFYKEAT